MRKPCHWCGELTETKNAPVDRLTFHRPCKKKAMEKAKEVDALLDVYRQ